MTEHASELAVTSHVGRDLLQSSAFFNSDRKVIWEYVANSVQYVDDGVVPVVKVVLDSKNKKISISDNGRGMDMAGLKNYFIMHGENQDRKEGRAGRGYFGTGKSAAFGIANILRLTTVRDGKRSQVELQKDKVKAESSAEKVPIQVLEDRISTTESNGTTVEIEEIHLRNLDRAGIIKYIERQLARYSRSAKVYVDSHECEFQEPVAIDCRSYKADDDLKRFIGDVCLTLKVTGTPLDSEMSGVAIYSNGVFHEATLAGSEGKEMSQYIFGEIDVPSLQREDSKIPAFDQSRSMILNRENETVRELIGFIGRHVDALRRELVAKERERRASEEAKKLEKHAADIANVINQDFAEFKSKVARMKARTAGLIDRSRVATRSRSDDQAEIIVEGNAVKATAAKQLLHGAGNAGNNGSSNGSMGAPPSSTGLVEDSNDGDVIGTPEKARSANAGNSGGFGVEFDHLGAAENRAKYIALERTIYVNLDHPQLVAAKGDAAEESVIFKQLAYEVAFSEYSIALATEMANNNQLFDAYESIVEIGETINRLARRAAALFSN